MHMAICRLGNKNLEWNLDNKAKEMHVGGYGLFE